MALFQNIPGSGLVAPIFAFEVTSGGQYETTSRLVLMGHKTSAGSVADNAPTLAASLNDVTALAGAGSMLREMWRVARANAPAQEIWIVAVPAVGVAGTWTLTVGAPPSAGGVGVVEIAGEPVTVVAGAGDNASAVAAALAAAINAYFDPLTGARLPVTAAASSAVVTVTARHAGVIYEDLDIVAPVSAAANMFAGSGLTIAAGTAPSGSPDVSAAFAALGDDPAQFVVMPWSDSTNLGRAATAMGDTSGRWAWSRQSYGHVWTTAKGTTSELATLGLARNERHETIVGRLAGSPHPAWLWVAAVTARVAPWLADGVTGNVSRNQTGLVIEGLAPPRSRATWPGYAVRNALLASGIATWSVTADGRVAVDKLITTYRTDALGQPDTVFRDVQALYQLMAALGYMRAVLSAEHGQKALADTNPSGLPAVTTPTDIRATMIHAYEALRDRGVLEDADGFAARLTVERNVGNPNRVDVLAPLDRVNALDIIAANARLYAEYR